MFVSWFEILSAFYKKYVFDCDYCTVTHKLGKVLDNLWPIHRQSFPHLSIRLVHDFLISCWFRNLKLIVLKPTLSMDYGVHFNHLELYLCYDGWFINRFRNNYILCWCKFDVNLLNDTFSLHVCMQINLKCN